MLAAGFASASRAGAILLVIETVAVQFLLSVPLRRSLILAAAVASLSVLVGAQTLAARFAQPDPLEYRREIFRSAGAMVAEHPWAGFGLGTFPTVYPAFALFDSGAAVEHAHNDWLEWAAEGGVPFAALWLLLAASIAREAIRSVWGVGVLAVFLHAIVDYPFARFGVAAWAFLLIGALLARGEREVGLSGYLTGEI
jgi:O-antigen ligase